MPVNEQAYIYDCIRTPRGRAKADGALYSVKPVALLGQLLNSLQKRNDLDTALVDDIVIGCVSPVADQGADIARIAALHAGWHEAAPGVQLDRFCGSGLEAINLAAMKIRSGWEDLVVAGGVESMSRVPMMSGGGAWANDPDTAFRVNYVPQGVCADALASQYRFERARLDEYAASSHRRAAHAARSGYFDDSLMPVRDDNGVLILDRDEAVRADATAATLAALKPAFAAMGAQGYDEILRQKYALADVHHVHTAGNSSAMVDGAALALIGGERIAHDMGWKPKARIVATAVVGSDPCIMLTGPMPATQKVLRKAGMSIDRIDLFEVNEAFAAVVLMYCEALGVPLEKVNVNGGAIAMGHPLGATGAMLIGTLADELERRGLRYGLCTACVAAGMGVATIIERC